MEIMLVIVTLLLVIVTGFYTFNLSRISVFEKRYKVYESFITLLRRKGYFINRNNFEISISLYKDQISKNQRDFPSVYAFFYEKIHDDFAFNVESSRFLFDKEIYNYLSDMEEKSSDIKNYVFFSLQEGCDEISQHEKEKCFNAIENLFTQDIEEVVKKFTPYLEYEENILKYYRNLICANGVALRGSNFLYTVNPHPYAQKLWISLLICTYI